MFQYAFYTFSMSINENKYFITCLKDLKLKNTIHMTKYKYVKLTISYSQKLEKHLRVRHIKNHYYFKQI